MKLAISTALLVSVLTVGSPGSAIAQASAKVLTKCQEVMGKKATRFVREKLAIIDDCYDKLLACYLQYEKAEIDASKFSDCKAKQVARCERLFQRKLAKLAAKKKAEIDRKCTDVSEITLGDMTGAVTGLGWSNIEAYCNSLGVTLDTKADVVECLDKGLNCETEHLAKKIKPRVDELLGADGFVDRYFSDCLLTPGNGVTTGVLYVASTDNRITAFNARTGAYLNGTLENSSCPAGRRPWFVAANDVDRVVYVTSSDTDFVFRFEASNGAPPTCTVTEARTSRDPHGVVFNAVANLIYVVSLQGNSITFFDPTTLAPVKSVNTGRRPIGVAVNHVANILYVANNISNTVTYFDATTGGYLNGSLGNSSFPVGQQPREVAVNATASLLYVSNSADDTVTYLRATTGAYLNGTLANSSFPTGDEPWGVAVNPAKNILYVVNHGDDTVTYLDSTTGAYLNGSLPTSSFTTGAAPHGVAVYETANLIYVTNEGSDTVTFLSATTGAYMNGTYLNSSFLTGHIPTGLAVLP